MVTLCILDGFGIKKEKLGNAVLAAGTPYLDKLKAEYPNTQIEASGEAVGLPAGQMGNSEVGHLTIGGGRIIEKGFLSAFSFNPPLKYPFSFQKSNLPSSTFLWS